MNQVTIIRSAALALSEAPIARTYAKGLTNAILIADAELTVARTRGAQTAISRALSARYGR